MKNILSFLLLPAIAATGFSQAQPNYLFNDRVDVFTNNADMGLKCISWNSGALYLGNCSDSSGRSGTSLTFYDTTGIRQWSKNYFYPGYSYLQGFALCAQNNSSFYIAGNATADSSSQSDCFFAKFDSNGDSLFFSFFGDSLYNDTRSIISFSSDTLLLLTNTTSATNSNLYSISLSKTDTLGNIVGNRSFVYSSRFGSQVMVDGSNRILVGGNQSISQVFINVYDLQMNYSTTWAYNYPMFDSFRSFILTNNNIFICSTVWLHYPPNPNYFDAAYIRKLNLAGTVLANITIGRTQLDLDAVNICEVDTTLLALGAYSGGTNYIYFLNYSPDTICKAETWCTSGPGIMMDLCMLPGNKIAAVGYVSPYPFGTTEDHWCFLTTNALDFLTSQCGYVNSTEEIIAENTMSIFPDPAADQLTIKMNFSENEKLELGIFNSLGEKIYCRKFSCSPGETKTTVDVSEFSPGIYFIRLQTDGKEYFLKKFVVAK
ncbi:MAG: T9SS type A sorting domain-containing protein [Bacteroidetes bacterium]|nr:T9SS type A sorting domain-containing protein [Bacteroidota bacterium]